MEKPKLIQRFAERFSVDPNKLFDTLKATTVQNVTVVHRPMSR